MKPKLLWDELKRYGYVFSVKRGILMYGMVVAFAIVCGKFFRLDHMYLFLLCLWCACLFPFFLRNLYRNRYGQRQFVEINSYMEQFLYSFQKSGKILVTLKDVEKLFANGVMHTRIQEAIAYIEDTYDEDNDTSFRVAGRGKRRRIRRGNPLDVRCQTDVGRPFV